MNFKFLTSLLAGSVFALGSISLIACGGDSGSSAEEEPGTSSAQEIILSSASKESPLNSASSINGKVLPDGKGGFELTLTGSLEMNPYFIPEEHDESEDFWFTFDSLSFTVGKYGDDGKVYLVDSLNVVGDVQFPADRIPIASSYKQIPLNQDKIGCGKFVLYVWIYMSVEEDSSLHYTALKQVDFELECKPDVASSSSAGPTTCTELAHATVTLSNMLGDAIDYMSIDGAADAHQLTMVLEGGETYLQAADGISIYEEVGALSDVIQESICMEDIQKHDATKTDKMLIELGAWYIVVTPSGSYPVKAKSKPTGNEGELTLDYYKKK